MGARELIFEKTSTYIRPPVLSTAVKNILSTWLRYRKQQIQVPETTFQISATRSGWKEVTETAVALSHSRECTKESISALPNYSPKKKFGGRAEITEHPAGKIVSKMKN